MNASTLPLKLKPATLIKRYKRFLADVDLPGGTQTIYVSNTGAMTGCGHVGETIWYSTSENPKRKYQHTWELTETHQGHFICVNTQKANQLLAAEIEAGSLADFSAYSNLRKEVKYGKNSRIDLLLEQVGLPDLYIEIKSCTLLEEDGFGYFPDAVTQRGQKHLLELMDMVQQGHRAMLLFAVMHTGITQVRPAAHIDPAYARLLQQAAQSGVEIKAYSTHITANGISVAAEIPIELFLEVL